MSWRERMGRALRRARTGASNFARATNIRVDIKNLEGRRDAQLRGIGERACALDAEGRGPLELTGLCAEVRETEVRLAARQEDLERVRNPGPAGEAMA